MRSSLPTALLALLLPSLAVAVDPQPSQTYETAASTAIDQLLYGRDTTTSTSTSLVCSTASVISVTSCDATDTYSCTLVATTTSVCASGLYCDTDSAGNQLCMVRQDGLTTSGAIVSIFLAVVLAGMISSIIFLCCKDRSVQKKLRAKAEAAAIAKANAAPAVRPDRSEMRSISGTKPTTSSPAPNPFSG